MVSHSRVMFRTAWQSERARFLVLAAVTIGGFHLLEHIVQVVQRYVFAMPTGNGIAGSIADIEPVHLVYNLAYFALVIAAVRSFDRAALDRNLLARALLIATIAIQGWHVFEHVVKITQYLQMGGLNGVGGVFGLGPGAIFPLFPIPLLHFGYNLVVYLPFLFALTLLRRDVVSASRVEGL